MQPTFPERRPELDALRGLFLVWMTLTHLPTHFSDFMNNPFGFVSSAEGFVVVSALLVGRLSIHQTQENATGVRARLWKRTLQIYGYHLVMLAMVFTVAAAFAIQTHRAAISNLLNFYLAHPVVAVVGSVFLPYCPPLLDILPMYVIFLFFTPLVLSASVRFGWRRILLASGAVWVLAQFGLREIVHNCHRRCFSGARRWPGRRCPGRATSRSAGCHPAPGDVHGINSGRHPRGTQTPVSPRASVAGQSSRCAGKF
jgi:hypothetical protein